MASYGEGTSNGIYEDFEYSKKDFIKNKNNIIRGVSYGIINGVENFIEDYYISIGKEYSQDDVDNILIMINEHLKKYVK